MTFSLRARSGEPEDTPELAAASEPGPASGGDPEPAAAAAKAAEAGEASALCPTPIGDALGLLESCDLSLVSDGTAAAVVLPAAGSPREALFAVLGGEARPAALPAVLPADVWPLVSVSGLADPSDLSDLSEDLEDIVLPQSSGFEINEAWPVLVLAGGGVLILLALLGSGGSESGDSGNGGAPANRAPASVEAAPATLTAMEGEATSWDVSDWFTDADAQNALTFSAAFEAEALPEWLELNAMTGALTIAEAATDDAEVGAYTLAVTASDAANATAVHTVKLTVENVAEAPATTTLAPTESFSAMEGLAADLGRVTTQSSVRSSPSLEGLATDLGSVATWFSDPDPEGTPGDIDSLTFTGTALPDWLVLNAMTGALTIAAGATDDAEVGVYTLVITATDGTDLEATHTITLTVENVDEAPTTTTLAPNVSLTAVEGLAANWNVSAWFKDEDAGDSLTFTVSGLPAGGWLTWDRATNELAIAKDATDDEQVGMYTLTVTASDTTKPTALTAVHTVKLTVVDVPESPPSPPTPTETKPDPASSNPPKATPAPTPTNPLTTTLAPTSSEPLTATEGMAADWNVVSWFSDPDAGDSLTFTVSGLPAGGWLTWDKATNRLAIAAGATDDAQVGAYTFTVTASDTTKPTALTAVHAVTLDVENVHEAPDVEAAAPARLTAKRGKAADWDVSDWFTDEDMDLRSNPDVLTYTGVELRGAPGSQTPAALPGWLELDRATGALTIAKAATGDTQLGMSYALAITATDTTARTAVHTVELTITDIVNKPSFVGALPNRIAPSGVKPILDNLPDLFTDRQEDGTKTRDNQFRFEISSSIGDIGDAKNIVSATVSGSMLVLAPGTGTGSKELWHQEIVTLTAIDNDGGRATAEFAVTTRANVLEVSKLASAHGFILRGDADDDRLGYSVSGAGDVNGDGYDDFIAGALSGDDGGGNAGEAYIIYGKADGTQFGTPETREGTRQVLDTTNFKPTDGFIIRGDRGGDQLGVSVSGAGDINGDGLDDLVVGAYEGDDGGGRAGEAYIVYGKAGTTGTQFGEIEKGGARRVLDTTKLKPTDGFILLGDGGEDHLGVSVAGAGDINGDGIDDLIVGAYKANDGGVGAGEAYIVYGKAGNGNQFGRGEMRRALDVGDLKPTDGFILRGDTGNDFLGVSVSGAGDINGDGLADLIVGAYKGDDGGTNAGEAYIVYGKASTTGTQFGTAERGRVERRVLDTTNFKREDGFILRGHAEGDQLGYSVSGAGDINGDGLDDLIVGAPFGDDGGENAGEAYVIYGKVGATRQVLDVGRLQFVDGFILRGNTAGDQLGWSVSGAGDVNGDGLADLIIGANEGDDGGEAYIVYGKAGTDGDQFGTTEVGRSPVRRKVLDTTDLAPTDGFIIQSDASDDTLGSSVSGAGDINGDGFDDLIVGAAMDDDGGPDAGEAYIVYGGVYLGEVVAHDQILGIGSGPFFHGGDLYLLGGAGDDRLVGQAATWVLYGGAGDDVLELADATFRRVDGGSGVDTLVLGPGVELDLTEASVRGRVRGIEVVSLSEGAMVTLDLAAFYALVESRDNGGSRTAPGEALLRLEGASGAVVTLKGDWAVQMDDAENAALYALGSAKLLVDDGLVIA